jgi:glucose/arabinose dehydrogenase
MYRTLQSALLAMALAIVAPAGAVQGVALSKSAIAFPTGVTAKTFYDTDSISFSAPVWIGTLPGAPGSLLIGEGTGGLQVLEPGVGGYRKRSFGSVAVAFLAGNDGLLGIAFHPHFAENRRYFVCYNPVRGRLLLEERQASPDGRTDAGPVRTLLQLELGGSVHQAGDLHFGPDGYLYASFGDGGNPNVYNARSQDSALLLGKMLRLDVDHRDSGLAYAVPPDNPFPLAGNPSNRREIWAMGLRQPWRFSFDIDGTLAVGEVGDWVQEEVDVIRKGGNYGWSRMEGTTCFNKDLESSPSGSCDTAGLIPPAVVFPHLPIANPTCLIGGYVFRGDPDSPFYGAYLFGDFASGQLYATRLDAGPMAAPAAIGSVPDGMSTFGVDEAGNLYTAGYNSGKIYRLTHPYLIGMGVAIRRPQAASAPRALVRGRLFAADFPGARSISLLAPDGRVLRRYGMAQLAAGVDPDLPRGLYLARAEPAGATTNRALLLP